MKIRKIDLKYFCEIMSHNLFATSEPPKYSNCPNFFFKILFTFFLLLDFFEARSKEFINGAAD